MRLRLVSHSKSGVEINVRSEFDCLDFGLDQFSKIFITAQLLLNLSYFCVFPHTKGPCNPNPCKNDAICEVTGQSRRGDVFSEYVCKCQPGFEGVHCQNSKSVLPPQWLYHCRVVL